MSYWQPAATFGGVIDVSHNNGPIKWSMVPATIVLVFIKASQGSGFVDPQFAANLEGALDTKRLVVPYHFLTDAPVTAQLTNLFHVTAGGSMAPIMLDWEPVPPSMIRPPVLTMENVGKAVQKVVARAPLAYHGLYDLSSPTINAWPWMIPKYGPQPQGPRWLFWQNTPHLTVPGIPNPTDHSIFAGTEDELRAWHATGKMPAGFA